MTGQEKLKANWKSPPTRGRQKTNRTKCKSEIKNDQSPVKIGSQDLVPRLVNNLLIRLGDIYFCQGAKRANIGYIQPMSNAGRDK